MSDKPLVVKLAPRDLDALTFQEYTGPGEMDGVYHVPLRKHRALEGAFMEYMRLAGGTIEGLPKPFAPAQISVSWAEPGRINAFHIHPKAPQDELWCVAGGRMLVWLADVRTDSPTCGLRKPYLLSAEQPALLHIPTGVAHGYKAGGDGAMLLYATSSQFNIEDPNEGRLPWDHFGATMWEEDRG